MRNSLTLAALAGFLFTACQTTPPSQYDKADVNADGKLSRDEGIEYLVATNFTALDTNMDGKVTKAEWNPENDAASARLFAARDADKDGAVTIGEAGAYAKKKGTYDSVFIEADTDKDGSVSRAEAKAYTASKEGPVR